MLLAAVAAGAVPLQGRAGPPPPADNAALTEAAPPELIQKVRVAYIDLPLVIDGAYIGDLPAQVAAEGKVLVERARLRELLQGRVNPARLAALADGDPFVALDDLAARGVPVTYDPSALQLVLTIPVADRPTGSFSIVDRGASDPATADPPADTAAGLVLIARPRYIHDSAFRKSGFDSFSGEIRGFASVGGFDGWTLLYQGFYDDGARKTWRRGDVSVVHDDYAQATRLQLGDFRPTPGNLQSQPPMLGVSFERNYREIQPFRTLYAIGRQSFTLERPARVSFEVNGLLVATRQLEPGSYNVRDFPFVEGANDVRIIVEDAFGRREISHFSTFASFDLLDRDITLFGLNAGFAREAGDSYRYDGQPIVSGFYEKGVSDRLTLGGRFEVGGDGGLLAFKAARALPWGVAGVDLGVSQVDGDSGLAALVQYRAPPFERGAWVHEVSAQAEYQSADFTSLGTPADRRARGRVDARWRAQRGRLFGTLSASHEERSGGIRITSLAASLGTTFRRLAISVGIQPRFTNEPGRKDETRFLVSIGRTFGAGSRYAVRASAASDPADASLELNRFSRREVGDFGYRLSADTRRGTDRIEAQADYTAARFEAQVFHSNVEATIPGDPREIYTEARIGMGFGYADGAFGWGRPFDQGFVIVSPHPSLDGRRVITREGAKGREMSASGRLGPALIPLESSYSLRELVAEVSDLPMGYDLGRGRIRAFPAVRSGYVFPVGSASNISVIGRLRMANGTPLSLAVGDLVPLEPAGDRKKVRFFTNATGRMAAEQVAPGRYAVRLADGRDRAVIDVKPSADFVFDAGQVTLKEPQP